MAIPDDNISTLTHHYGPRDDFPCPTDICEHIAEIEAGWSLGKPWKAFDSEKMERRNIEEVREMLERWTVHGIKVGY